MKPASEAVVMNAIDLIMKDLEVQNRGVSSKRSPPTSGDDMRFGRIDRQIELLSETLRTVEARIQSRIFAAKKRRNSLCFIHRLPIEVLAEIFKIAVEDPFGSHYPWLAEMSRVCTLWATAIHQTPGLWTVLFDRYDLRLVNNIIAKSRNCPLSLSVTSSSQRTTSFLDRLLPVVYRWGAEQLFITAQDIEYLQRFLKNVSAPKLKKLLVYFDNCRGDGSIDVFQGGAGCLEELDLEGVSLPWASPLLSGLRILRLGDIYDRDSPTTDQVLTILMQCPDLLELRITCCDVVKSDISHDHSRRVDLPHLRDLELIHILPSTSAYSILSGISSSRYDVFHFYCDLTEEDPSLSDLLSHVIPSIIHLVTSAREIQITLEPSSCHYWGRSQTYDVSLDLHIFRQPPKAMLEWLIETFGDAMDNVPTIGVEVSPYPSGDEELAFAAIETISRITKLQLAGHHTPIIDYLTTSFVIDGTQRWPLPELESLTLEAESYDADKILGMVQSRYSYTTNANSKAQLPYRLLSLTIYDSNAMWDRRVLKGIRKIVGKGVFR
ncbi:hypothetical protein FRB99_008921 [Tulasnella sp. 403]|nr:hypothetical protein FRB99_008921 [Tulasnella sp. 403]